LKIFVAFIDGSRFLSMNWRNPKNPLNVPKAVRLRDRAGALKSRADTAVQIIEDLLGLHAGFFQRFLQTTKTLIALLCCNERAVGPDHKVSGKYGIHPTPPCEVSCQ